MNPGYRWEVEGGRWEGSYKVRHGNFRRTLNFPLRLLTRDDMLHYVFHAAKIGKKWICGVDCETKTPKAVTNSYLIFFSAYKFHCSLYSFGDKNVLTIVSISNDISFISLIVERHLSNKRFSLIGTFK